MMRSARSRCTAPSAVAVTGSYDRTVVVWDLGEGRPMHTLTGHADAIAPMAISPDGSRALSAASDGDLILWNIDRGRIRTLLAHRRGITFLAGRHNWPVAVTGSMDGTMKVWDLARLRVHRTQRAHLDGVSAGAVSAGSDLLLTGGPEGTLRLWRLPTCEVVRTVEAHAARCESLLHRKRGIAFSSSYDRYLKAWAISALEVRTAFAADSAIAAVAVSQAGDMVVAGTRKAARTFFGSTARSADGAVDSSRTAATT